ncbi:MAG TPA: hypothetical protein VH092_22365 [Urbifossiella sp.]|jgi:hypothetical protein|nr:hypothetical protein [Urbifossiella sp.]
MFRLAYIACVALLCGISARADVEISDGGVLVLGPARQPGLVFVPDGGTVISGGLNLTTCNPVR